MLIRSPRHTAADRELWNALEEADLVYAKNPAHAKRVARSMIELIEFLKQAPAYVGVSWGKDSVAVAYLVYQLDLEHKVPLIHLRPTNHNPDTDLVRDAYLKRFPDQPYEEVPVDYTQIDRVSLPEAEIDRQTDRQWYAAIRELTRRYGPRHILGIRAEESGGRLIRMRRWGLSSKNACAPIGWWTTQDVFAYLAAHRLPVHPAYACLGGGRWKRERIRVAEIGDTHGRGTGRREWEQEYYGDVLRRVEAGSRGR